ncbi:pilus assembly protein [Wenzhouxiangella sp. EGI_FJ10409]|uniref:pilus assembly protein n=1 Tax=Wenzhouxiangella sp. EGI_FJ10409 TaxID=3243767 RepID=UPI0035DD54AD
MYFNKSILISCVAVLAFGVGHNARAELDISNAPLFLVTPVKPALIMALDDSGSMDAEVIFPSNDGAAWWHTRDESYTGRGADRENLGDEERRGAINFNWNGGANGTWKKYFYLFPNGSGVNQGRRSLTDNWNDHFAVPPIPEFAWTRSPAYNAQYFDPALDYPPYPDTDTQSFGDVSPTAAPWDPILGADDFTVDLTDTIESRENQWTFRMYEGMEIPAGTRVNPEGGNACDNFTDNGWHTLTSDLLIRNNDNWGNNHCDVAFDYFPATFWLPEGAPLPDGFGFTGTPLESATGGPIEAEPFTQRMYGYEIKPGNFASNADYKSAIQKFANWFTYYRKRSMSLRGAIGRAFAPFNFLRVGRFTINNRNSVDMIDLDDDSEKSGLLDWAYGLRGSGGTPNREAVKHLGDEFMGDGDNAPVLEACQKNFGMLFTDGYSNNSGPNVGNTDDGEPAPIGDSYSNTMADIAYSFYESNIRDDLEEGRVPTPSACDQDNPPLNLDCQNDPHMNFFGVSMGGDGLIYQIDEDATEDPWNNPPDWFNPNAQRNPSAIDDMWHASISTRGEMFSARSADEVAAAIESVLSTIAGRTLTVGFSANSTRLDLGSLLFQSTIDSTNWTGDVLAFEPGESDPEWVASDELPEHGERSIYTWSSETEGGIEFNTSVVSDRIRKIILGIDTGEDIEPDERLLANALIDYVRGDQSREQDDGPFRERNKLIGDIVSSRPVYAGPSNEGWARVSDEYAEYLDEDKQDRTPVVYVGSNDGMLHAFDADSGTELFAYVPASVHGKLRELADPDYGHEFFVDGQTAIGDVELDGDDDWTSVLVGTLGAGGRGVYALDIGNPDGFDPGRDVLWELTAEDDEDIGYTFGEPIITRLESGEWVAVFGNGYNSADEQAHLFVVSISDGDILHKVELGDAGGNGLSGVTGWRDVTTRTYLERVYGGDLNGTMWRVDFNDSEPSVYFDDGLFTDPLGDAITATPTLAAHPSGGLMVYYGTGKLVEVADRSDESLRRLWAVRDRNEAISNNNLNGFAELELETAPSEDGMPPQRRITGAETATDGWYVDLEVDGDEKGERILSKPRVVFGTLIATSYEPNDDPCLSGGTQRIYVLDALTGAGRFNGGGGSSCTDCAGPEVGTGAPIAPPVVISRPEPPDSDEIDFPGYPDPEDPEDPPTPPGTGSTEDREGWCSEFGIPPLAAGGSFQRLGTICEGRQVWRQRR